MLSIRLLAPPLIALLSGCQLGYVLSQGTHQLGLVWSAEDVSSLRARSEVSSGDGGRDPDALTAEQLGKLDLIADVKRFAEKTVGLDADDAYTTFYDTRDRPVSYVVSASHPLALVPYQWSFPFAGRVAYKGFFDEEDARDLAARLEAEGWDTHVGSVAAFSTLGWFDDPILSSMLEYDSGELAELILHELVHRTVYFRGNTAANESMATALARDFTRQYLRERFSEEPEVLQRYEHDLQHADSRNRVRGRLRADLDALYRSPADGETKLRIKRELFADASRTLARLGLRPPRAHLRPTNASVLASGQYQALVPIFEKVIARFRGDRPALMAFFKGLPRSGDPVPVILRFLDQHRAADDHEKPRDE